MKKFLTKKDLVELFQIDLSTVNRYIAKGIFTPVKNIDCVRFNPDDIEKLTQTTLEPCSPILRRKLERELEELKAEKDRLQGIIQFMVSKGLEGIKVS